MQTPTDIGQQQQRTHALRRERAPPEHERSDQRHDQQQKMPAKAETVDVLSATISYRRASY